MSRRRARAKDHEWWHRLRAGIELVVGVVVVGFGFAAGLAALVTWIVRTRR